MASGAALVVSVITDASLATILIYLGAFAGFLAVSKWLRSSHTERKIIRAKAILCTVITCIFYSKTII